MSEFDFLIKNTTIVEGSGRSAYKGSIGISGERIVDLGSVKGDAKVTLDAKGMSTLPGFIDAHSHGDQTILWYPHCESLVMQGVTTFIGGNCGHSMAPLEKYIELPYLLSDLLVDLEPFMYYRPPLFPYNKVNEWMEECYGWSITWRTMEEYLNVVEDKGLSMNYVPQIGHGAIRYAVMGLDYKRHSTKEEQSEMREHIHEAMEAGCFGMSTGLDYDPDVFASSEEVVDGVSVLKEYDGVYSPHWRRTGRRRGITGGHRQAEIIEGIVEVINTCKETGVKLNIAHIYGGYEVHPSPPPVLQEAVYRATLNVIDKARREGLPVTFDTLQYMERRPMTYLCSIHFTPWLRLLGSREKIAQWLVAKDFRREIRDALISGRWFVSSALNPVLNSKWAEHIRVEKHKNPNYEGKSLAEVASNLEGDHLEALFDLVMQDPDSRGSLPDYRGGDEGVKVFYQHPCCMISTDTFIFDDKRQERAPPYNLPSINHYSAYPKFLTRYVKDQRLFTLEEAVMKFTSLPAKVFDIKGRGTIKVGHFADLVLLDFNNLKTISDVTEPRRYPQGIAYVFVNGKPVRYKQEHTKETPGKVIRRDPKKIR
jgi:N-acyl-D-aspartate/D-glutamate deacylase